MRIAFDNIIFALQTAGGISVYWNELLKRSPVGDSLLIEHTMASQNKCYSHNAVHQNRQHRVSKLPPQIERYLPVFNLPGNVDIFHSSYYRTACSRSPQVVTVYDFTYERYRNGIAKTIHSVQKRRAVEAASRIICISHSTKKDLLTIFGSQFDDSSEVIHLAPSSTYQILDHARATLIQKYDRTFLNSDQPILLFVGARRGYKRFDLAINSLQKLPNYSLVVVGGELWTEDDKRRLKESNVAERVHVVGSLREEEITLWYNTAHALLYLSDYEGFGLPVLEAAKCGCPVVAQNSSSIPEVHGFSDLLVEKNLISEIVERIQWLEHTANREKAVAACQTHAASFDWDKTWVDTYKAYQKIM